MEKLQEIKNQLNNNCKRVYNRNMLVQEFLDLIDSLSLIRSEERFDNVTASKYIESIYLGHSNFYPIILKDSCSGILTVHDGNKKLNAIIDFKTNKLVLEGLTNISAFNGITFSDLDGNLCRRFNLTYFNINIIDTY